MISFAQLLAQIPLLPSLRPAPGSSHQLGSSLHGHQHCPNPPSLSCPFPPPRTINTCCMNHPSGHFLQTQFWDTSPAIGSNTSWTIHGLWPDLCTGGFDQYCDSSRSEHDIRSILSSMNDGNSELLEFMDSNWLSIDGRDENLWRHEWNKHGTCISTIEPACYGDDALPHADLLDYFVQTTSLFKTLDTYSALADAEILPSFERTYKLADLKDAIESSSHGYPVTFRCRSGELDEIWYHFSVRGSLRNAGLGLYSGPSSHSSPFLNASTIRKHFVPTHPDGAKSNCPAHGIKYLPKSSSSTLQPSPTKPAPTRSSTNPTATSTPFTGKGHLEVYTLDTSSSPAQSQRKGCLIRRGEWYTSGSCATYLAQSDIIDPGHRPLFSLSSSFSPCLINPVSQKFECTKSSSIQGIFSSDLDDSNVLSYRNTSKFYAPKVPGRFEKVDIFANSDGGDREIELEIRWMPV